MNDNELNAYWASDDEILEGVRKHMASIEPLVPQPPSSDWSKDVVAEKSRRTVVRSRIGFAGLAPLVLVAALAVVVVGVNLGRGGGSGGTNDEGVRIDYQLRPAAGQQVTSADMDTIRTVISARLAAGGWRDFSVDSSSPDIVTVTVMGTTDFTTVANRIGQTGRLEFVPLPPETYGVADASGATPIPIPGDSIDPALPVLLDSSQLDPSGVAAGNGVGGSWVVDFEFTSAGTSAFATWSSAHVNEYFAIVLDGKVLSVPYVQSPIQDGRGEIGGSWTESQAKGLAALLKSGALPVPLAEISAGRLGATPAAMTAPPATIPASIPADGRTLGNANAPHTIDVYEDFQCPNCQIFATQMEPRLIANYVATGKAKIVFHDFIVVDGFFGSTESLDAANAAMCAADEGKFWPYHDWLFANQGTEGSGAFGKDRLKAIAASAGIPDLTAFNKCVDSGTHNADVTAEQSQLPPDVAGVPAIIIDGGPVLASYDYDTIAAALDRLLGTTPRPSLSPIAVPTIGVTPSPLPSAAAS